MGNATRITTAVALAIALGGCGFLQRDSGLSPSTEEQMILSAGDVGSLGCLVLMAEVLTPEQVVQARAANRIALEVLREPNPSFSRMATELQAFGDNRIALYSIGFLDRLKQRASDMDVIPPESLAYQVAEAFLSSCQVSLGEDVAELAPDAGGRLAEMEQRLWREIERRQLGGTV